MASATKSGSRPEGYGGLSALVSDVDALIAGAKQTAELRAKQVASSPTQTVPRRAASQGRSPSKPIGGWVIVGVAVVVLALAVWWSDRTVATPPTSASVSPAGRVTADAVPTERASAASTIPPAPSVQTRALPPSEASESVSDPLPPIGTDRVLSTAQIRYCLSESIRLDAARELEMSNQDVARFNAMIEDYNSRCGSYRYRPASLESARRAVEPLTTELRTEGRARFGY